MLRPHGPPSGGAGPHCRETPGAGEWEVVTGVEGGRNGPGMERHGHAEALWLVVGFIPRRQEAPDA